MQRSLVNESYLGQLKTLANEQNEGRFVAHLIDHLEQEYKGLLSRESIFTEPGRTFEDEVAATLHRLKNSFSNVGAESASDLLDRLHHAVERHPVCDADVQKLWKQFRRTADQTIEQLIRFGR
jgi:hypothetical protein